MIDLEEVKARADKYIEMAQHLLLKDKFLEPIMFSVVDGEESVPIGLKLNTSEDMENVKQIIEEAASYSDALILLMDFYLVETSDKIKPEDLPADLKDHPNALSSLSCIIHAKKGSLIKQFFYAEAYGRINFFEGKWEPATFSDCHFQNPYLKNIQNKC